VTVHAPAAGFGDTEFYPEFIEKAAVLVVRIPNNHSPRRGEGIEPSKPGLPGPASFEVPYLQGFCDSYGLLSAVR
jgi:hypothetical protein